MLNRYLWKLFVWDRNHWRYITLCKLLIKLLKTIVVCKWYSSVTLNHMIVFKTNNYSALNYSRMVDIPKNQPTNQPVNLFNDFRFLIMIISPVSWKVKICWLNISRGVRPPQRISWIWYWNSSDDEALVLKL